MSSTFFTADLHLGHDFVANLRGFDSTFAHDMALCDNWERRVGPKDVVWVLGDLAVHHPHSALETIADLPGTKHLIAGNHDPVWSGHRTAHRHLPKYLEVFSSVQSFARLRVQREMVLLSHFPYAGSDDSDHTPEERYTQYRLPNRGAWLLHGHTHNPYQTVHGNQIHVGVDAWNLSPVHLGAVADIIGEQQNIPKGWTAVTVLEDQ